MEIQGIKYPHLEAYIKSLSKALPINKSVIQSKMDIDQSIAKINDEIIQTQSTLSLENKREQLEFLNININELLSQYAPIDKSFELIQKQFEFSIEEIKPKYYSISKKHKDFLSILNDIPEASSSKKNVNMIPGFDKPTIQNVLFRHFQHKSFSDLINTLSYLINQIGEPSRILNTIKKPLKTVVETANNNIYTKEDIKIIIALLDELKITDKGIYRLDEKKKSSIRAVLDALMLSNKITKVKQENGHKQIMTLVSLEFVKRLSKGSKIYEDHFEMAKKLIK